MPVLREAAERIVLTGATGFIGGAILEALLQSGKPVTALVRGGSKRLALPPPHHVASVDLTQRQPFGAYLQGARTVIHAASYVGSDPEVQRQVNAEATLRLVDTTQHCEQPPQLISISTMAVVGSGPHRGSDPEKLPAQPESSLSESRLAGERSVLAAGGTVIRPHFVFGIGDKWLVPGLIQLHRFLGGRIDGGAAKVSIISSATLGRLVAKLPEVPRQLLSSRVLAACNREPVTVGTLLDAVSEECGASVPNASIPYEAALALARRHGVRERFVRMAGFDSWFSADELWDHAGRPHCPPVRQELKNSANWYRTLLNPESW